MKRYTKQGALLLLTLTCMLLGTNPAWAAETGRNYSGSGSVAQNAFSLAKTGYTVTLDHQGADTAGTTLVRVTAGQKLPKITVPKREGYVFHGYFTEPNGTGTQYIGEDGTGVAEWNEISAEALYAKWTIEQYIMDFNWYVDGKHYTSTNGSPKSHIVNLYLNDKSIFGEKETMDFYAEAIADYGSKYRVEIYPQKGYILDGIDWRDREGTHVIETSVTDQMFVVEGIYEKGSSANSFEVANYPTVSKRLDIEAHFYSKHPVTYDANGGTNPPAAQDKIFGTDLVSSNQKPTRTGYTFKEWNTEPDGSGTAYAAGATYTGNEDMTLYAQWEANLYTLDTDIYVDDVLYIYADENKQCLFDVYVDGFPAQENVGGYCQSIPYGTPYKVVIKPIKGYEYAGWSNISTNPATDPTSLINSLVIEGTIEAHYHKIKPYFYTIFPITYDLDGGTVAGEKQTYTKRDETYTPPTPEKEGFIFAGWSPENIPAGSTGAVTFTALWEPESGSELTLNANGGTFQDGSDTLKIRKQPITE